MIVAGWARIRPRLLLSTSTRNDAADAILDAWRRRQAMPASTWTQLQTRLQATACQTDLVPLCRAVHALSKLGFATASLLDDIASRSLHLPLVSSSFLVDLADTFGRARRFDRDLFRTISLRLATFNALVGHLSPCRASTLLHACARVGFADTQLFSFVSADQLVHVDIMPVAYMSRLVWALARTRMASSSDACVSLAHAILRRLLVVTGFGATSTSVITDIMWAYGVIADAINRRTEAHKLVVQLAEHLRPRLHRASPHSLASCLWALAALQAAPDDDFLQTVGDCSAALIAACRSNSCVAILAWSLARLRFAHNGLSDAVAALPPTRWTQFRSGNLNMVAWALAQHNPTGRYDAALLHMAQAAESQLAQYRASDLCVLLITLLQGVRDARRRIPLFDRASALLERDLDLLNARDRAMLLSALIDGCDDGVR